MRLPAPLIEIDGHRVLIGGQLYRACMTQTNAIRVASALQTLLVLGCDLPEPLADAAEQAGFIPSTTCLRSA